MRLASLLACSTIIACSFVQASSGEEEVTRVKIASNYISTNGCHDDTQTFTTGIPDAEHLDRSYRGVLGGIEVVETVGLNTRAYRNFVFINNGTAITYQLYVKGKGYWVNPPKLFGHSIGGGYCYGAGGASKGIDIYAHYKTAP